jgi:hypothetical protein
MWRAARDVDVDWDHVAHRPLDAVATLEDTAVFSAVAERHHEARFG